MANLIVDARDQAFVLYEMLHLDELCATQRFQDYSKDMFDMTMEIGRKLAAEEIYPANAEGDNEGCRLEDGQVYVPKCFHRLMKLIKEGGWPVMSVPQEYGGQGFPYTINVATIEAFIHNFSFTIYPYAATAAGDLIRNYGTERQKKLYMEKMYAGEWGGTMALTEPEAGSDVGNLKTKAIRQSDGTFRLEGTKQFITCGDSDLFENIVHPVLARIEGDPPGTKGISIFLVPKYRVNEDGSLGPRNDYSIGGIEKKMGLNGSSTCNMSFGDNGECYAELLGEERQGMKIMFQMMNEARIAVGLQSLGTASAAYLHALNYSRERKQGSDLMEMNNPEALRVPIIHHPDVRRMLLWMKAHVEGMRALVYLLAFCIDQEEVSKDKEGSEKWKGLLELLTPICKAYCSDIGFRIAEMAIQVYGGYGYCRDYPVEQFMRDLKVASIYEGTNGIQALDLVGRKMAQEKGKYFMTFLNEVNQTISQYKDDESLKDVVEDLQGAINLLSEIAMFFSQCVSGGKFLVPVANAYPFLNMMGCVTFGWLLLWQAGIASEKLEELYTEARIDASKKGEFLNGNKEAAFYYGKILTARFYMKNVLPQVVALAKAMKSEDLSVVEMPEQSFAT